MGFFLLVLTCSCKKDIVPTITTSQISDITGTTATCGGTIIDIGSEIILSKGVCWSSEGTPSVDNNTTIDNSESNTFSSYIIGLNGATTYYVRAYATNSVGTGYGATEIFTTFGQMPSSVTLLPSNIKTTGATLKGTVNANYLPTTVSFEYGTTSSYGSIITFSQNPVTGNTNTEVSADISGLSVGTIYYFRIKTENSLGTNYGNNIEFKTLGQAPIAITNQATGVTGSGAMLNGKVNTNCLTTTVVFEYGTTSGYGSSVSISQNLVTGETETEVSAVVSELKAGAGYHFRIKAENSLGTTYGNDMSFTTLVADIDGNVYDTVRIGTKTWMKENLKTTRYSNGDLIGTTEPASIEVPDMVFPDPSTLPKYQWAYNGDESNVAIYGRLYTWYAANDSRNVCPFGWHVPAGKEWGNLGGDASKSKATCCWPDVFVLNNENEPVTIVQTNENGFTALPAGYRNQTGGFEGVTLTGIWWSSKFIEDIKFLASNYNYWNTCVGIYFSLCPQISPADRMAWFNTHYKSAYSVRCVKD